MQGDVGRGRENPVPAQQLGKTVTDQSPPGHRALSILKQQLLANLQTFEIITHLFS